MPACCSGSAAGEPSRIPERIRSPEPCLWVPGSLRAASLEEAWRWAWGLDRTRAEAAPSSRLFPYLQWIAQSYPDRKLGLVEMTGDLTLAFFFGLSLFGSNSLSNGRFSLRQQIQQTADNVSFVFIPSLAHSCLHQDPATWPAPSPPYGSSSQSLSSWMKAQLQ